MKSLIQDSPLFLLKICSWVYLLSWHKGGFVLVLIVSALSLLLVSFVLALARLCKELTVSPCWQESSFDTVDWDATSLVFIWCWVWVFHFKSYPTDPMADPLNLTFNHHLCQTGQMGTFVKSFLQRKQSCLKSIEVIF